MPIQLEKLEKKRSLSEFSTFKIGGPCQYFIKVTSNQELQDVLDLCKKLNLPYFILGKGSNCLFDDKGFSGITILNKIEYYNISSNGLVDVGSGFSFSLLGAKTAKLQWSGLEFASGIPGSVGGAIFMNAGANNQTTSTNLESVTFLHESGDIETLNKKSLTFSYRCSPFQTLPGVILSATFQLHKNKTARDHQLSIFDYRKKTQPYGKPSAGCIFKNPENHSAGKLIEQCGLKGLQIGGASISTQHANFIINNGEASAQNVLDLICLVQKKVKEKTGILLKKEVRSILFSGKVL